ncbi:MAG: hypothetical protein GC205_11055 [Bacteroidetes bacterium]|nr:hypothetical protein [Bacteroidota bacterium]
MFFRHLFKAFVLILTILSVNLLTAHLDNYLSDYRGQFDALTFTLLGMGVVVLLFYPLFAWMDQGVDRIAREFLTLGKRLIGRKLGMILAFLAGFYGLFYLYGDLWFQTNLHPQVMDRLENLWTRLRT